MAKSDAIDVITRNVVIAVDNRFRNDDVPQNLLNYFYLTVTGLIISLGIDCVDDIFNAIDKISFIKKVKVNNVPDYCVVPKLGTDARIAYQFYINNPEEGNLKTLEFMVREYLNVLCINHSDCNNNDKLVSDVAKVLETEDIINTIIYLAGYDYEDKKFAKAIKAFDQYDLNEYYIADYENVVSLFRPLYKFGFIRNLFIRNLIDGNYKNIYKEFDTVLGDNSFSSMVDSLKEIDRKLNKKNIPTFEVACSYLNIRNKFIQNYILLKFSKA